MTVRKTPTVTNHICPNCGRCDHCGQTPRPFYPAPNIPWYPYPYIYPWYQPKPLWQTNPNSTAPLITNISMTPGAANQGQGNVYLGMSG